MIKTPVLRFFYILHTLVYKTVCTDTWCPEKQSVPVHPISDSYEEHCLRVGASQHEAGDDASSNSDMVISNVNITRITIYKQNFRQRKV